MRGPTVNAVPRRATPGLIVCLLAGLQAGIIGVFQMLACFIVSAFWTGDGIWTVPNLFSTVFYGEYGNADAFLHSTWAGIALMVVIYGLLGAIWGWWWKDERKPLLSLFGALTGLVTYFLFFDLIWPYADSLISISAPVRQLQVAHILWGAALAASPRYARQIMAAIADLHVFMPADVTSEALRDDVLEVEVMRDETDLAGRTPASQDAAESSKGDRTL